MMSQRHKRFFPCAILCTLTGLIAPLAAMTACPAAAQESNPTRSSSNTTIETPQWRPALHFSPRAHWMNDPNGPFWLDGTWHLFYQYNPDGMVWGHTSWDHATSHDLLHWHEEPVALAASPGRDMFSGSVVVDRDNRSGLGKNHIPPLIALYTTVFSQDPAHPDGTQAQSLAYSLNRGATWERHERNPILTLSPDSRQFRDPSVVWYAPGQYWVMTTVVADAQVVKLYRSRDLKHWDFLSDFQPNGYRKPGMLWEMPTLVALDLDGNRKDTRWVMIVSVNPWSIAGGSGVEYFTGRFDGTKFTADPLPPEGADPSAYHWLDHGADNYAAIRIANTPGLSPRLISWMSNWDYADKLPTAPWRGQMTLPVALSLRTLRGKPHLYQVPTPEYDALVDRSPSRSWAGHALAAGGVWRLPVQHEVEDISLTLHSDGKGQAGITVRQSGDGQEGTRISYDFASHLLSLDRSHSGVTDFSGKFSPIHIASLLPNNNTITLHLVVDRSSVEIFANDGELRMTDLIFPHEGSTHLSLFAQDAPALVETLHVTGLDHRTDAQ